MVALLNLAPPGVPGASDGGALSCFLCRLLPLGAQWIDWTRGASTAAGAVTMAGARGTSLSGTAAGGTRRTANWCQNLFISLGKS